MMSYTHCSLHVETRLIMERPKIVSSVLQFVSDESDFFLAAEANSSMKCTLIEIDEDALSEPSDALLLPSVAEIAGPLDPRIGELTPPPDLSVLSLVGEDRYDCRRCSDATFDRTLRKMNQKNHPKFLPWLTVKYCIHNAADELCPVKMIPCCETCLLVNLSTERSLPPHPHQDPAGSLRQVGSSSKCHCRYLRQVQNTTKATSSMRTR